MDSKKIFQDLISANLADYEVSEILEICSNLDQSLKDVLDKDTFYFELCYLFCTSGMQFNDFKLNLQNKLLVREDYYGHCLKKKISNEEMFSRYYSNIFQVLRELYADKDGGKEFRKLIGDEDEGLYCAIANAIIDLLIEYFEQTESISFYEEWLIMHRLCKNLEKGSKLQSVSIYLNPPDSVSFKSDAYISHLHDFLKRYNRFNPLSINRKRKMEEIKKRKNVSINIIALRIVKVLIKYGKITKKSHSGIFVNDPNNNPIGMSSSLYRILFRIMKGLNLELLNRNGDEIELEDSIEFFRKRIPYVDNIDKFGYDDINGFYRYK